MRTLFFTQAATQSSKHREGRWLVRWQYVLSLHLTSLIVHTTDFSIEGAWQPHIPPFQNTPGTNKTAFGIKGRAGEKPVNFNGRACTVVTVHPVGRIFRLPTV